MTRGASITFAVTGSVDNTGASPTLSPGAPPTLSDALLAPLALAVVTIAVPRMRRR